MFLITGGMTGSRNIDSNRLTTTEVMRVGDNAWTFVGNLPVPLRGLRGVNLGNRLLMFGTNSIDKIVV